MRYVISDLRKHHTRQDIAGWWLELPARRWSWWKLLLWQPGSGWLRLKPVTYEGGFCLTEYGYEPYADEWVAPPLTRLWYMARWRDCSVWRWAADSERCFQ